MREDGAGQLIATALLSGSGGRLISLELPFNGLSDDIGVSLKTDSTILLCTDIADGPGL